MAITSSSDLPEDLTHEILARLPVKSLLRFKCVRKSWYALIKNPSFISKHLNYVSSKENNEDDNTRIALRRWDHSRGYAWPVVTLLSNKTVEICHDIAMPFFDDDDDVFIDKRFCGPCNGIICVFGHCVAGLFPLSGRTHGARIALWNPATREFKELLDSDLTFREHVEVFYAQFGFGFDSKSNDYKVVRMRYVSEYASLMYAYIVVEVYNLSTESWRRIDDANNVLKNLHPVDGFSTYLNGFCYWWARDDDGAFVISFDLANEVFEKIPLLPEFKNPPHLRFVTVLTLNESIALGFGDLGDSEDIVVWMLNRDGERKTWTKQLNLPFQSSAVLGFLRSGEALIRNDSGCFMRYDPISQETKHVINYDSVWGYHLFRIAIYVESLVSLKGAYELDY